MTMQGELTSSAATSHGLGALVGQPTMSNLCMLCLSSSRGWSVPTVSLRLASVLLYATGVLFAGVWWWPSTASAKVVPFHWVFSAIACPRGCFNGIVSCAVFLLRCGISRGRPCVWDWRVWTVFQGVDTWVVSCGGPAGHCEAEAWRFVVGCFMLSEQCVSLWPILRHW